MARPEKEGMDYFPHDVDASNDEKIEILTSLYGNDGYAFYFILLERIYRNKHFCIDVSESETREEIFQILSRKIRISLELFEKILNTSLKYNLFSKYLFDTEGIITSEGIQKRANLLVGRRLDMQRRYNQKNKKIVSCVVSDSETIEETQQETESETQQRKEKKRKEKKSIIVSNDTIVISSENDSTGDDDFDKEIEKTETTNESKKRVSRVSFESVIDLWNEFAEEHNLTRILKINTQRKQKLQVRMKEKDFDLKLILEKIANSDFLMGKTANSKNWKIDFDFIIANDTNFLKILEGKYDNQHNSKCQSWGNLPNVYISVKQYESLVKKYGEKYIAYFLNDYSRWKSKQAEHISDNTNSTREMEIIDAHLTQNKKMYDTRIKALIDGEEIRRSQSQMEER